MLSGDGSFGTDGLTDGYAFIPPFRDGVTSDEHPYEKGDEVKVLIRSMTRETYDFMTQVQAALQNGGMFGRILANVPSNIKKVKGNSGTKIVGWFAATGESSMTTKVE
jgi:hypothetical protein